MHAVLISYYYRIMTVLSVLFRLPQAAAPRGLTA